MSKKNGGNTKGRIVSAAWKLFYEQGYANTTIEEIIEEADISKGSFYHYFEGQDALLGSLSYVFDEKYEELMETMNPEMSAYDKLIYLNQELFFMIENSIPLDLLASLYSSQLQSRGDKNLLDHNRTYYRVLRQIIKDGQAGGEFRANASVNEIVKDYAMCERALLYDWCLCNGEYGLCSYAKKIMPMFLLGYMTF